MENLFPATQVVFTLSQIIVDHHGPGDPEKLPKEIVLKRAADLAEALYSMPRLVLETSMEPWSMKMTMSLASWTIKIPLYGLERR